MTHKDIDAGAAAFHTGEVVGSIPTAPTITYGLPQAGS
jgi:hypothetical protein